MFVGVGASRVRDMFESAKREARLQILAIHARGVPLADDVDLTRVAALTIGFSAADRENLVNEAALAAGSRGQKRVTMTDVQKAGDKVVLGTERRTVLQGEEKKIIAYHEAGHALAATLLPHADPPQKVTIVPRGRSLGATEQLPPEERHNLLESYLRARLGVALAGRTTERIVFGETSSGAEQDLKQAPNALRYNLRMGTRTTRILGAAAALLVAATASCAHAPPAAVAKAGGPPPATRPAEASDAKQQDLMMFVLGNVEFLLLHEVAHLLIAEKDFPIVGPTENAADYIATWALLNEKPFDPNQQDRPLRFLLSAANAFAVAWRSALDSGAPLPYWGEHALSIQRYYQITCLLYGSNPTTFARIPEIAGLPPARAAGCVDEYRRTDKAIRWLIATYGRKPSDPPPPRTTVEFEPPKTLVSERVAAELESQQLLERTADRLNAQFTLARPFKLVVRSCGRPEAAWMPGSRELVICYELMDYIYALGLGQDANRLSVPLPRTPHAASTSARIPR